MSHRGCDPLKVKDVPSPLLIACPLQELIYKEFFSQGDLVGGTRLGLANALGKNQEGLG